MPIDAGIYSQIRQPEPVNLLAFAGQAQQLQGMQQQNRLAELAFGDRERAIADAAQQRDAVRGFGADTTANYNRLLQTGNLGAAQGYQKSVLESQGKQAETAQKGVETTGKVMDNYRAAVGSVRTPEQARQVIAAGFNDPVIGPVFQQLGKGKTLEQALSEVPDDPAQFQRWQAQAAIGAQKLAEFVKVQNVNTGGQTITQSVQPATGQVTQLGAMQNTVSPGEQLQADTSRRGQDMVDARARETIKLSREAQANTYDPERGVLVDRGSAVARPVVGADGRPIAAKPSEAQKKEQLAINQQRAIIQGAIADVERTPDAFSFQRGLATMAGPLAESVAGRFDSDAQTQARSYLFNNVSRVINERAGAAQSAQELARLRGFLPSETDAAPQVISKLKAFETYLGDLEAGTQGKPPPSVGAAAKPGPAQGAVEGGYVFMGGNPADPKSWKKQ